MLSKVASSSIFFLYDSTWDWTLVWRAVGEHSNHYADVRLLKQKETKATLKVLSHFKKIVDIISIYLTIPSQTISLISYVLFACHFRYTFLTQYELVNLIILPLWNKKNFFVFWRMNNFFFIICHPSTTIGPLKQADVDTTNSFKEWFSKVHKIGLFILFSSRSKKWKRQLKYILFFFFFSLVVENMVLEREIN